MKTQPSYVFGIDALNVVPDIHDIKNLARLMGQLLKHQEKS